MNFKNLNKLVQSTDIPVNIKKKTVDFFAEYIYLQYNEMINSLKFVNSLSKAQEIKIIITGPLAFYHSFQKYLKSLLQTSLESLLQYSFEI